MLRTGLLCLLVIVSLVLCGVASSTASALFAKTEIECKEPGIPTACLAETEAGKLFEATGTEAYTGKLVPGTEALLEVPSLNLVILCKKDVSVGTVSQTEPLLKAVTGKGTLTFTECKLAGAHEAECKVTEPIKTKVLKGTVIDEMPISAGIVEPETGTVITEIEIGSKTGQTCPATLKGINPVKGSDLCITSEAEVMKVVHKGECTAEGSKLEFGANKAIFECKAEGELEDKTIADVSLG